MILRGVKLRAVSYFAESGSVQYHTSQSQSLQFVVKAQPSIIGRGVTGKLCAVSYCSEPSSMQYHTARSSVADPDDF